MTANKEKVSMVSSVDKAIDILLVLGETDNKTIRELGQQLDITKSTLHRILQTLEVRGLVKKNNLTEKYALGYKILELGSHLKLQNEIRELAITHMEGLRDRIGDTVQLAILEDDEIMIIETVEGTNALRVFAQPGQKYPITYGNFGKVFLAYQTPSNVLHHIKNNPLKKYASASIVEEEKFIIKVNEVRETKISISVDDPIEGAFSMAVPIVKRNGDIVASLAIAGVKTQENLDNIDQLQDIIKEYAERISNELK